MNQDRTLNQDSSGKTTLITEPRLNNKPRLISETRLINEPRLNLRFIIKLKNDELESKSTYNITSEKHNQQTCILNTTQLETMIDTCPVNFMNDMNYIPH